MTPSTVQHPVAIGPEGELVWASDLADADDRPSGRFACAGCSAPVLFRCGPHRRAHFAHRAGASCTAPESALHRTAIVILAAALTERMDSGEPYLAVDVCPRCRGLVSINLAAPGGQLAIDRVWTDGIRPDILILDTKDAAVLAVEVVVTHDVDTSTWAIFERESLPVLRVWPHWEGLHQLRGSGLRSVGAERWFRTVGEASTLRVELEGVPCEWPRHPITGSPSNCTCGESRDFFVSEVIGGYKCWKCAAPTPLLEFVEHCPTGLVARLPSTTRIGFAAKANPPRGVLLDQRASQGSPRPYLMQICPRCKASLGDAPPARHSGLVDTRRPSVVYQICQSGHWSIDGYRPWPPGAVVERLRGHRDLYGQTASSLAAAVALQVAQFLPVALEQARESTGLSVVVGENRASDASSATRSQRWGNGYPIFVGDHPAQHLWAVAFPEHSRFSNDWKVQQRVRVWLPEPDPRWQGSAQGWNRHGPVIGPTTTATTRLERLPRIRSAEEIERERWIRVQMSMRR